MTLPFRRRHNDAEASHERARSIIATGFLEPTDPADDAWLEAHLAGCADCLAELRGFADDRDLLRGLRSTLPEPPRDLWARTAASIEREAGRHDRAGQPRQPGRAGRGGPRILRMPIGVLSGVVVVLVVVATSFFPRGGPLPIGPTPPRGSDVGVGTPGPEATPLAVTARGLSWVEGRSDGTFQLVFADVSEVCVSSPEACAPIDGAGATRLELEAEPESMLLAPDSQQLVVVTKAAPSGAGGNEVIVVPVMTPTPSRDPEATPTPTPTPTLTPEPTPIPEPTPTLGPDETAGPTPPPTPDPSGSRSILSDVVVVGEAAYSEDGQWLAFAARPADGSSGPDLYLWHVGIDDAATAVTSDHRTFFAGWLGNRILASRVETADEGPTESPTESPDASGDPAAAPTVSPAATRSPKPDKTPKPGRTASPGAGQSGSPDASPDATPGPAEDHPVSFLLDPSTSPATVVVLAGQDIWRPVVNTESGTIVYWAGTLVADEAGTGWELGTGRLVIDGWVDPAVPPAVSPDPGASAGGSGDLATSPPPSATSTASIDPLPSPVPTPPPGPAGTPVDLAAGPVTDFDVRFDPTGTRLAVWIRDPENPGLGTLRLVVIDPRDGLIDPALDPLPATTALRGFSIGEGRVAWVTPPGQDGNASHVHVLAWTGDEFGQVRSIAADRLFVVR
ncbi:MAG: hypothetical protein AB1736_06365 [Chloroflexota bacterium]